MDGGGQTRGLAQHRSWNCLVGYGLSRVAQFEEIIEQEREFAMKSGQPFDRDMKAMTLYNYHESPFDGSGRLPRLRPRRPYRRPARRRAGAG